MNSRLWPRKAASLHENSNAASRRTGTEAVLKMGYDQQAWISDLGPTPFPTSQSLAVSFCVVLGHPSINAPFPALKD